MGECGHMPQNENTAKKKTEVKKGTGTTSKTTVKKGTAVKKTDSKKTAGKKSPAKKTNKRTASQSAWWALPVTVVMLALLFMTGLFVSNEMKQYEEFKRMREIVSFDGFYPGVVIEGVDVGGRQLGEVLSSLQTYENGLKNQVSVTLKNGDQTWNIVADDLDYQSDYEKVVRAAYQLGREGTVQQRYEAIRSLNESGAVLTITRGYDEGLLRIITDQIADELSYPAVDATVYSFDTATETFTFTSSVDGRHVDAEELYQSTLRALSSGTGGQTLNVNQTVVAAKVKKSELQAGFGKITEAKTNASNSSRNRLKNIQLALETINGVCVKPGETFSFNAVVGQRTTERGYKMAGAFVDGLTTEEVGGGICQVSTTLFNAAAKANLEITERQPHSRPVAYVDKGKDAAVSWPNQDFKFTNNTEFPIYIVTSMGDTADRCIISIYGHKLPDGMTIKIEAETTETIEPEDPRYIYTTDLMTGQKELVEEARKGYKAVAHKIYLDADGNEIKREVLCYSRYAAAGAVYKVGQ